MRIPKQIKIGAYVYAITFKKNLMFNDRKVAGLCENDKMVITLEEDANKIDKEVAFMHECLHAISYCHEFKLSEKAVEALDHTLVAFLKNNKLTF